MKTTLIMVTAIMIVGSSLASDAAQAGTIHAAKNVGSTNGAELATYIVEKGKPLITQVK